MRLSIPFLVLPSLLLACSGQSGGNSCQTGTLGGNAGQDPCQTSGGSTATGGNLATGGGAGASATGGESTTGGAANVAGASSTGGAENTGGALATGGNSATGGNGATGGNATTGGASSTDIGVGGAATGGTSATGGAVATGGQAADGTTTGGAVGTGGMAATGGRNAGPPYVFPQNNFNPRCSYPVSANSQDASQAYAQWKADLVVSDGAGGYQRVRRPDNENGTTNNTVSEGIGYGMVLAVVMDDQSLFDNLLRYSQLHLDANGLMIWLIEASGTPGIEDPTTGRRASGSATDADEDMAFGLAMAAQKWGGQGSLSTTYRSLALTQISRIWTYEFDHSGINMLNAGDSWGKTFAWNPSYFAPNEYRLFAKLDTAHTSTWNAAIDKGYQVLAASQNATTGLFPAWTNSSGVPTPAFSGAPTNYQYDAARVPFRIGWDYCDNGDTRARTILARTSAFFSAIGAPGIVDGYSLAGTPTPENTSPAGVQSALFVGAAGVGAMGQTSYQTLINDTYARLVTQPSQLMLPKSYYFNLSWKVFSLLMMSGNLFDYTLYPGAMM